MSSSLASSDLLTIDEVASYLDLQPSTIGTWCRDGRLPALKLGKEWRVRRAALDAFLQRHEVRPTLVAQFQRFITVPDTLLGIAATEDYLFQLDAAFFQVGQTRDALLVKIIGGASEADDTWRTALERYGLPVRQLEADGQMRVIHLQEPQHERAAALRDLMGTEGSTGQVVFANFNWVEQVSLQTVLAQQEAIAAVTQGHPLTVKTSILQAITDDWMSSDQRAAQDRYAGVIWLNERGLGLRRMVTLASP